MHAFVYIAMFGWIPVTIGLFMSLPPRRALLTSFLGGWLFLPIATIDLPQVPDYTKVAATVLPALLGLALFDPQGRLWKFRPRWFDLPMAIWCICPFASSLANDLGPYEAFSASFDECMIWGLPYLFGRVYVRTPEGLLDLAKGMVIGGLIYVPLCMIEMRMAPQLHIWVYGYDQHNMQNAFKYGGWRPTVFMEHGLAVSLWMSICSFLLIVLRGVGPLRRLGGYSMGVAAFVLPVVTVFCKSVAAVIWLIVGLAVYHLTRRLGTRMVFIGLIAFIPAYLVSRLAFDWSGENLVEITRGYDEERSESLNTRMFNEERLKRKAFEQPWFGWGRFGRNRIYEMETGKDMSITDSMWIIQLGTCGLVGLFALFTAVLLPPLIVGLRLPPSAWSKSATAPLAALAVASVLYGLDLLINPVINPLFTIMLGGLASFPGMVLEKRKPPAAAAPAERRERRTQIP